MGWLNQTSTRGLALVALASWSLLGLPACAPPDPSAAVSTFRALQPAPDGDLVVAAPLTVLNRYGRLGLAAARGTPSSRSVRPRI